MKGIAIYGSTGSIGKQTIEVIQENGGYEIVSLVCNSNISELKQQILDFQPRYAAVIDEQKAEELRKCIKNSKTEIVSGRDAAIRISTVNEVNIVMQSAVGVEGLEPTLKFIEAGKDVALSNKESIVVGGHLVMESSKGKVNILPVDSEPSTIFQCLQGNEGNGIKELIITASGGPFLNLTREQMENVPYEQALKHPTWKMGPRITIDSATLMNKAFEVIEASRLFDIESHKIKVRIHPESIVHSAVIFEDNAVMSQSSWPNMKIPIQYALYYPKRMKNLLKSFEFDTDLHFAKPDMEQFPCLQLGYDALRMGGTATAVLNTADEVAVTMFKEGKIGFVDIERLIRAELEDHKPIQKPTLGQILKTDRTTRASVIERSKSIDLLRNKERNRITTKQTI